MIKCTCGNPKYNLECICKFLAANPGDKEFTCIWCGCYQASKARCSDCEQEVK